MSIFSDNIKNTVRYIEQMCGGEVSIAPKDKMELAALPFALVATYRWFDVDMLGVKIVFAEPKESEACTPIVLQKHGKIATENFKEHVVFVLAEIASYNLTRMTKARVNFVVPGKEIFIPSLLMQLQKPSPKALDVNDMMPPMAQCLVIYHLLIEPLDGTNSADLAKRFNVSYPNMSRALKWLETKEIIKKEGGKQKTIKFLALGKSLWEKVLPMMDSPIEKKLYTDSCVDNAKYAGEVAAEHYTMMASPIRTSYAISKQEVNTHKPLLDKKFGENEVEVWRYNPSLTSQGEFVDKLSLYLSLRNTDDERLQMELEEMINSIQW